MLFSFSFRFIHFLTKKKITRRMTEIFFCSLKDSITNDLDIKFKFFVYLFSSSFILKLSNKV